MNLLLGCLINNDRVLLRSTPRPSALVCMRMKASVIPLLKLRRDAFLPSRKAWNRHFEIVNPEEGGSLSYHVTSLDRKHICSSSFESEDECFHSKIRTHWPNANFESVYGYRKSAIAFLLRNKSIRACFALLNRLSALRWLSMLLIALRSFTLSNLRGA